MNRGRSLAVVVVTALSLVVAGCGSGDDAKQSAAASSGKGMCSENAASKVPADFSKTWSDLIKKAKAEGTLQVITGTNVQAAEQPIWDCFAKAFGIKVVVTAGSSSDVTARVLAERTQDRYTVDVSMLGSSGTQTFLEAGAFGSLKSKLIHPDITDRSHWYLPEIPWYDADTQEFVTLYIATLVPNVLNIYYNTEEVTKDELADLTSLQDLLKPEWKGKIVIGDVAAGEADREAADSWMKLGQPYFEKFLNKETAVVPLGASRQYTDGIVRGQWEIGVLGEFAIADINAAIDSGLPIANLTRTLAEGPDATIEGQLAIFDKPANPAAAELFSNWLLSKPGQTAYNALLVTNQRPGSQSFRNDVPQGVIPDEDWDPLHKPGFELTYDPEAFATAQEESLAFYQKKFKELNLAP